MLLPVRLTCLLGLAGSQRPWPGCVHLCEAGGLAGRQAGFSGQCSSWWWCGQFSDVLSSGALVTGPALALAALCSDCACSSLSLFFDTMCLNRHGRRGRAVPCRAERWALYHQLTLLERALRRTAPPDPGPGGTGPGPGPGGGPAAANGTASGANGALALPHYPDHPFNQHLQWCLPPVAQVLRDINALQAPEVGAVEL